MATDAEGTLPGRLSELTEAEWLLLKALLQTDQHGPDFLMRFDERRGIQPESAWIERGKEQ